MAAIPKRLRELLDHYRLRWRIVQAAVGVVMTLCAILAGAELGVLADRLLRGAPGGLRWAFLAVLAAIVVTLLLRHVLAPAAKRMADQHTAARLGRNFPNMAEDLVTGVELSRDEESYGASQGLVDAALRQIDQLSAEVSWRQAVPLDRLRRVVCLFGVLALAMAMAYLFAQEAVTNSVGRLLNPNREDFFSYTQVQVEPGNQVVRKGDDMQVRFSTSGRSVTRATVEVRAAGESFNTDVVLVGNAGAWQSGPLLDDLRYRVEAGDGRSPWYVIRTVPAPALIAKSVRVTLPAYTARPEMTVENAAGPITVVNGPDKDNLAQPSTVVIQVRPAPRGSDPKLACSAWLTAGKETWPMKAEGDLLVSPRMTPTKDVDYQITLKDGFGLTNRAPEIISIKVVPDTKPAVTLPKPGEDLSQLPGARVSVAAAATDDYGVRDLKLQMRLVHGKSPAESALDSWKTVPLADGAPALQRLEGSTELVLADFKPAPGDRIELRAMAADYADEAMFRNGYSPIYRINIISNAEHLNLMLDRLRRIAGKLDLDSRKQAAEAKLTGDLSASADKANKSPEAADAQQREQALRDEIKGLENQLAETIADLSDNPLTPASLLAELSQMASAMDSAESKPMKQAAESLSKSSQSPAGKSPESQQQQQQSLQEAQEAQKQAAEELEKLSKELSRVQRRKLLEILADEAERLSHDQADARTMTGKTARDIGGRQASELPPADLDRVARLAGFQRLIAGGISTLDKDIEKVLNDLTQEKVAEAEKASDALGRMQDDRLPENADEVASQISENNLFAQTPRQQAIADSLMDVAQTLRTSDDLSQAAKELQEFIKRQKEINGRIEKLIGGDLKAADPAEPPPRRAGPPSAPGAMNPAPAPNEAAAGRAVRVQAARPGAAVSVVAIGVQVSPVGVAQNPAPAPPPPPADAASAPAPAAPPAAAPAEAPSAEMKLVGGRIGERQGMLEQDVTEHSLAMRDLFKEFGLFKLETADKLDQASTEMDLAAQDLPVPSLPQALDHGTKALALLEEAAQSLPEEQKQMEDQEKGTPQMSTEEMMRLAKIIGQMKRLHADTSSADRARQQSPEAFPERVMDLARRQGRIRYDTEKLARKLQAEKPNAAEVVALAKTKMDAGHSALESGDAGSGTRKTQSEAIQLLEALLKDQQNSSGSSSSSNSSAAMMAMQNMASGTQGGGFHGGANGALAPSTLDKAGYHLSSQQQYDDKLGAGLEAEFPPEFRGLLNSYFDQVRKESRP